MCDTARLTALAAQATKSCGSDSSCLSGVTQAVNTLSNQQCKEPFLSKCQTLNPYGAQDKGYVYGCQGVVTDVLRALPPTASTCDRQVIYPIWENWGNTKCGIGGGISKGECLMGLNAGLNAVLSRDNCTPYHSTCAAVGSPVGFVSCNNVMRSYLYGSQP